MAEKTIAEGRRIMDDRRFESARSMDGSEDWTWMSESRGCEPASTGPISGDAASDMDAARSELTGS